MRTVPLLIAVTMSGLTAWPAFGRGGGSGGYHGSPTGSHSPAAAPASTSAGSTSAQSSSNSTSTSGHGAGSRAHHRNRMRRDYGYYYPGYPSYVTGDGTTTSSSSPGAPGAQAAANGAAGSIFGDNPAPAKVNPNWFNTGPAASKDAAPVTPVDPELAKDAAEANAAHERARIALKDNPEYQAALAQKMEADAQAAALADDGPPKFEEIYPLAQRSLAAGKILDKMEREAMANDPSYRPKTQAAAATGAAALADASK